MSKYWIPIRLCNFWLFLIFNCCLLNTVQGQANIEKQTLDKVEAEIREFIDDQLNERFNGSLLIAQDGKSLVKQHFGWTDADSLALINTQSRFNVGSFAKEIPGVLVYDLALEGLVELDSTIDNYLNDLPNWSKKVTVLDLLFYTSGLPKLDFKTIRNDAQAYAWLKLLGDLYFEPGSDYFYGNWNNFLLAKIIEKVVDKEYQDYAQNSYFEKLGMSNSFYDSTAPSITQNTTKAYSIEFGNDEYGNPNFKKFEFSYAPLYMTIGDVLAWLEFVHEKYKRETKYTKAFFCETSIESQGPLGTLEHENEKVHLHLHGGSSYSYETSTYRNYSNGMAIILMTNMRNGIELKLLNTKILDILKSNGVFQKQ